MNRCSRCGQSVKDLEDALFKATDHYDKLWAAAKKRGDESSAIAYDLVLASLMARLDKALAGVCPVCN